MVCPKCGFDPVSDATCPRCGVVVAKYRGRAGVSASSTPTTPDASSSQGAPQFKAWFAPPPAPPSIGRRLLNVVFVFGLVTALAGSVAWLLVSGRQRPGRGAASAETSPSSDAFVRSTEPIESLAQATPPPFAPPPQVSAKDVGKLSVEDWRTLWDLVQKLQNTMSTGTEGDSIKQEEARRAEELAARYPEESKILDVAEAVLLRWAAQRVWKSRTEAIEILRRAIALKPQSVAARAALVRLVAQSGDWPLLEQEARALVELDARSLEGHEALGQALMRLGRDSEAIEELKIADDLGHSPLASSLLDKLRKGQKDESAMREQSLGAFTLRYEGTAHEGIGSDVLRALEHHFATLALTFDHRPTAPIAVILYTEQSFYQATGAPRWSGGLFDNADGRIRLPVGGLSSLPPEIDSVLLHELTHAFVADISHGRAPGDLHEGLAQRMEGLRIDDMLNDEQLRAVATGRIEGPARAYLEALVFTEYLIEQRGWGGINDLLQAMGQGEADPFKTVYGQRYQDVARAAQERFQMRHGT